MNLNPFKRKPDADNERLLAAIVAVASQPSPHTRRAYFAELLKSSLFMAEDPEASPRPILLEDHETGDIILPVFSSQERLVKFAPDARRSSRIPLPQLCQLALKNEIQVININPDYGPGSTLMRHDMESLAKGQIPPVEDTPESNWDDPTFVPMGSPKLPDQATLDKITAAASGIMQRDPIVNAAYLILLGDGKSESRLAVAVDFASSASQNSKTLCTRQIVAAVEQVTTMRPVEVTWLEGEHLRQVSSRSAPFYERE